MAAAGDGGAPESAAPVSAAPASAAPAPVVERPVTVPPSKFSPTDGKNFSVRSANYKKSKRKEGSDRAFFDLLTVDLYSSKIKQAHIVDKVTPPWNAAEQKDQKHGVPELFVINFMIPSYEPPNPLWGQAKEDGEGYSIVFYFRMSDYCRGLLEDVSSAPPSILLLQKFCAAAKAGEELKGRLKGIPKIVNIDELDFGSALNKIVQTYNAKPFLTGPKFHSFKSGPNYLECDVDIHRYCYMARKASFGLMSHLKNMVVDFALVVEAQDEDELPEQVLGCLRLLKIDPSLARPIEAVKAKEKEAEKKKASS
jgi:hypothetical protein